MIRTALLTVAICAVLITIYLVIPAASHSNAATLIRMTIVIIVFVVALAYQLRSILVSDHPNIRAAEALVVSFVAVVVAFSFGYLSMSHASPGNFTQPLDKVKAVYFTLTIITTVGFGDITPATDAARVVVCVQYLLDLFLILGVARVFLSAARHARLQREALAEPGPPEGAAEA